MLIFRWIVGSLAVLLLVSMIVSYTLGLSFDADVWMRRGKRLRHWVWLIGLFWFNFEIWSRVVLTIVNWNR